MGTRGKPTISWRPAGLAIALLALAAALPARAQEPGLSSGPPDAPPNQPRDVRPGADDPPPLNLGGAASGPAAPTGRWSAYAAAVQSSLDKALAASGQKMNAASYDVDAELWIDPKGHITQARLVKPSGNPAIDAAFRSDIFPGLTLPEPAKDLPLPIRAHIRTSGHVDSGISGPQKPSR
jgi:TonB C terminal